MRSPEIQAWIAVLFLSSQKNFSELSRFLENDDDDDICYQTACREMETCEMLYFIQSSHSTLLMLPLE